MKRFFTFLFLAIGMVAVGYLVMSFQVNGYEKKSERNSNKEFRERENEGSGFDAPDKAMEQDYNKRIDPHLGTVPYERLFKAREIAEATSKLYKNINSVNNINNLSLTWQERGPGDTGGRTRAIMFDPNDAGNGYKKLWAGSVSGGLWYTNDITAASPTWNKVDDFWDNLAITSITYDPGNTSQYYAGTGEGYFNLDAVRGGGIWKTTNSGTNWTRLASTVNNGDFYYVQKVLGHSTGIYAATSSGLWRTTDGGTSWTRVLDTSNRCDDIEVDANNNLLVGFQSDGIYKSSTGNSGDWTKLNNNPTANGFPTTFARIEIATAPSDVNVIYTLLYSSASQVKSTDGGATWTAYTAPDAISQGWYDLILAVAPNDPNRVIAGTSDIYSTTDGGTNWTTQSYVGNPPTHPDIHALVYKPGSATDLAVGTDGGVYYSTVANTTPVSFDDKNKGYNTVQYYACAIHPTTGTNYFIGGTQDNGCSKLNTAGIDASSDYIWGGDGAFCFIDQDNPNFQIASGQYYDLGRSTDGGATWNQMVPAVSDGPFICPADYDDNANILYSAYNDNTIRRVLDVTGTPTQSDITGLTLGGTATHIRVSPYSANTIYVGTNGAKVFKLTNANTTPTVTDISAGLPTSGSVSCIELGASDNQILVTYSNYGVVSVWETTNGGTNWTNREGDLPDMPVNWALYNPDNRSQVILATDIGTWITNDITVASPTWVASNTGLANVRVDMLQYRASDGTVLAATHGRGMFTTTLTQPFVLANLKVFLEGPYSGGGSMGTGLNGILPTNDPYSVGENVVSIPSATIVDWVKVQLRGTTTTVTATRAAFIKNDGSIVDLDGTSPVKFNGVSDGNYYVVVIHRNHLAVMSAGTLALSGGSSTLYNFTTASTQFYGGATGAKDLGSGVWGMIAGDGNGNGQVQNNDSENIWKPDNGTSGYKNSDFNMNGQVQNNDDENYWKPNNGKGTSVPAITP